MSPFSGVRIGANTLVDLALLRMLGCEGERETGKATWGGSIETLGAVLLRGRRGDKTRREADRGGTDGGLDGEAIDAFRTDGFGTWDRARMREIHDDDACSIVDGKPAMAVEISASITFDIGSRVGGCRPDPVVSCARAPSVVERFDMGGLCSCIAC